MHAISATHQHVLLAQERMSHQLSELVDILADSHVVSEKRARSFRRNCDSLLFQSRHNIESQNITSGVGIDRPGTSTDLDEKRHNYHARKSKPLGEESEDDESSSYEDVDTE